MDGHETFHGRLHLVASRFCIHLQAQFRGYSLRKRVGSVLFLAVHANVAQLVEQLICNQPVGGSSPSIGSVNGPGEIPKRPTGADCKSAVLRLRRFESCSPHNNGAITGRPSTIEGRPALSGSSSVGRASAFQAECRGFESRLPLYRQALLPGVRRNNDTKAFVAQG